MRISDWSSDVCSSDLGEQPAADASDEGGGQRQRVGDGEDGVRYDRRRDFGRRPAVGHRRYHDLPLRSRPAEIGRASCRERVCQYGTISVGAESVKKNRVERLQRLIETENIEIVHNI